MVNVFLMMTKIKKSSNTVTHELAGVMIPITVATHLDEQPTKRFSKLAFLILCETPIGQVEL